MFIKLPQHRNGGWYFPSGRCVHPIGQEARRYWTITYLMAVYWILVACACIAAFIGAVLGIGSVWIAYPTPMNWFMGILFGTIAGCALVHSVAKDLIR